MTSPAESRALTRLLSDRAVFIAAMEQASEAIIVTDADAAIIYANATALGTSGYGLAEVIGQNPRIFGSGLHEPGFFDAMWAHLGGGQTWRGVLVNRRKNGEVYEEAVTITPVYDGEGDLIAYVGSKRDLTVERRLEQDLSRRKSDRTDMVQLMNRVRQSDSIEGTAAAFCEAVAHIEGIDGAIVFLLQDDGTVIAVNADPVSLPGLEFGRHVPVVGLEEILALTQQGPWFLDLSDTTLPARFGADLIGAMVDMGITASGYVGMRWAGEITGLVSVATVRPDGPEWLRSNTGMLEEIGSFAGVLLGAQADFFARQERLRGDILEILDNQRFHPVFQPVISLSSGTIAGYEALTRFDDDSRPDTRVAEAHEVGLGPRFEAAIATMAVKAARELPHDTWLSINFSAAAILDGHAAQTVMKANRPVIVEITEHVAIESYPAVRKAVSRGGDVMLSVDDAGAGFASLRHILELDPDIVKLDITMIRDIDTDQARQALVTGMCHFAAQTGTTLIAEGVETQAEADMLRELGVELAQGFLFGRPVQMADVLASR